MHLPSGSYLYRASFIEGLVPVEDPDTGKTGLYFSNYPILALSMCLEYNSNMKFNIYKIKKSVDLQDGKYSFRSIHPERYYTSTGEFIPNVNIVDDENIDHFDNLAFPIVTYKFVYDENLGEVFLSKDSLNCLELVRSYDLIKEDLIDMIDTFGIISTFDYGYCV